METECDWGSPNGAEVQTSISTTALSRNVSMKRLKKIWRRDVISKISEGIVVCVCVFRVSNTTHVYMLVANV